GQEREIIAAGRSNFAEGLGGAAASQVIGILECREEAPDGKFRVRTHVAQVPRCAGPTLGIFVVKLADQRGDIRSGTAGAHGQRRSHPWIQGFASLTLIFVLDESTGLIQTDEKSYVSRPRVIAFCHANQLTALINQGPAAVALVYR